jgi:hypothetical protein
LTGTGNLHAGDIEALARARGEDHPTLVGGAIDATLMADEEVSFAVSLGLSPDDHSSGDEHQRIRHAALAAWLANQYARILSLWRLQAGQARTLAEQMVVGDGLAEAGNAAALQLVEQLRPLWPPVAAGIEARFLLRQGKREAALRAFETSLLAYRADPWPPPSFMLRTMNLAVEAARGNPAEINRLFAALALPFAVHMMDEARASALVALAKAMPTGPACVRALSYFEPDIPWNADFLAFRAQCYQAAAPDLAPHAHDDLRTYLTQNPSKFPASLLR